MNGKNFPWGKVIDRFVFDFDGTVFEVTKYESKMKDGAIEYHCEELRQSSSSLFNLLISWITYKQLGLNNGSLVCGICKALDIKEDV